MSSARQVTSRIKTAKNISKITKAMEMVSASKMRRAQAQALQSRPFAKAIADTLHTLAKESNVALHDLFTKHSEGDDILVCLSTDRGLSGSFNPNLFRELVGWRKKHPQGKIVAIGKKAVAFAQFSGMNMHAQFTSMPDRITLADTLPITTLVTQGYLDKEFKSVTVLFMDFVNTLSQKPMFQQILPLDSELVDSTLSPSAKTEYLFEPSAQEILDKLVPYYIENAIFQAFLESKASEHSARMVAMKNASENAQELQEELKLIYNKSRQASITSELLDITTATLTLNT
ncbi:MAG: ATP synthase F1 subunit gamma [bacterium]|nr:ATP synthase F1 subunit gamma [bacterium]